MADRFQILFDGQAADAAFHARLATLEVEENADLPGAIQLTVPVATKGAPGPEDLTEVGEDRFQPYSRLSVVVTPDGGKAACVFDGYVLAQRLHLDRGTTAASLRVWGQDASCLMNLKENVQAWSKSDGQIANEIFERYGITAAQDNTESDSPQRTLMQRSTDAQFLRDRARRTGKLFRVFCVDDPGTRIGLFAKPKLDGESALTLTVNPPRNANVEALDFEWDVVRPSKVLASLLTNRKDAEVGDTSESGLALLGDRGLAAFTGSDHLMEARLTVAAADGGELQDRSASLLREAGWFARCEGEVDLARVHVVLRAGTVVDVAGAGGVNSGKYLVWNVRHTISALSHRMRFSLVRNAVGAPRSQGA